MVEEPDPEDVMPYAVLLADKDQDTVNFLYDRMKDLIQLDKDERIYTATSLKRARELMREASDERILLTHASVSFYLIDGIGPELLAELQSSGLPHIRRAIFSSRDLDNIEKDLKKIRADYILENTVYVQKPNYDDLVNELFGF